MSHLKNFFYFVVTTLITMPVFAEGNEAAATAAGEAAKVLDPGVAMAAALAIGLSAIGGALGQGRAAAAALEGIARNPGAKSEIFTPMILALALIESLVIYGLLIAFKILG
jgi:F-type H+-transporting ATPase subunit c